MSSGLDIDSNIDVCMTKFDPDRIKLRRAFSLSNIGEEESWIADEADYDESARLDSQ